jgi:hypothetical protein
MTDDDDRLTAARRQYAAGEPHLCASWMRDDVGVCEVCGTPAPRLGFLDRRQTDDRRERRVLAAVARDEFPSSGESDDALNARIAGEIALLPPMEIHAPPAAVLHLMHALELAARHPGFARASLGDTVRQLIGAVRVYFRSSPSVLELLRRRESARLDEPVIRIYFSRGDGHMRCRLFTAPRADLTFALCGELTFSRAEWPQIYQKLERAGIELVPDPD